MKSRDLKQLKDIISEIKVVNLELNEELQKNKLEIKEHIKNKSIYELLSRLSVGEVGGLAASIGFTALEAYFIYFYPQAILDMCRNENQGPDAYGGELILAFLVAMPLVAIYQFTNAVYPPLDSTQVSLFTDSREKVINLLDRLYDLGELQNITELSSVCEVLEATSSLSDVLQSKVDKLEALKSNLQKIKFFDQQPSNQSSSPSLDEEKMLNGLSM